MQENTVETLNCTRLRKTKHSSTHVMVTETDPEVLVAGFRDDAARESSSQDQPGGAAIFTIASKQTDRAGDVQSSHGPGDQRGRPGSRSQAPRGHEPGSNHSRMVGSCRESGRRSCGRRLLSCTTRWRTSLCSLQISTLAGSIGPRCDHPSPPGRHRATWIHFNSTPKLGQLRVVAHKRHTHDGSEELEPCSVPNSDELAEARFSNPV